MSVIYGSPSLVFNPKLGLYEVGLLALGLSCLVNALLNDNKYYVK